MSRKYELEISDFSTNEVLLSFGLSSDNPSGPEIQFNIQQLPGNVQVNNTITIFNVHPYYFNENQNLYGKRISLKAGMENTPLIQKIGYSGAYGTILEGWITNMIPEWNGRDTQFATIVQNYNPGNAIPSVITMHIGDPVLPKIKAAFQNLTGNVGLLDMGNVPQALTSKSNYQHKIKNIASLDNLLQGVHGLTIIQKQSGFTLYSPLSPAAPTQKTVYLKAGDFICQPSLIDGKTYTEVALTLIMRSDINVNDFVVIPQDIWVGISALDVVADARALIDMFKGKSVFSMFSGKYKVNSIWQLGDAKNRDPQAWATTLHATKA